MNIHQAFKDYFRADDGRVKRWFDRFSAGSADAGDAALAAFALGRRTDVWHLLTWRSRNAHAPVTVAQRPQYWGELDAVATVRTLLLECPEFWDSRELHDWLCDGELVRSSAAFFAGQLLTLLQRGGRGGSERARRTADRVRSSVENFTGSAQYPLLCRRLLHLLPQPRLLAALSGAAAHLQEEQSDASPTSQQQAAGTSHQAALRLVFADARWQSLDQLLLAHAAAFRALDFWHWLQEDETAFEVICMCFQLSHTSPFRSLVQQVVCPL